MISCVHVRNLHPGANVHPGTNLLHQICTTSQGGANSHQYANLQLGAFFSTPFTWPKYTPGVILQQGANCAYKRGLSEHILMYYKKPKWSYYTILGMVVSSGNYFIE